MSARIASSLVAVALLAGVLGASRLLPAIAQDLLPTPAGQLGGREDLPTAVGAPTEPPSPTPAPDGHPLVGAWSLEFADEDRAPARLVLAADGLAGFADGDGNRGAGVWVASRPGQGIVAVSIRETDAPAGEAGIALLQGTIAAGPGDDAIMLEYTTAPIDGAGIPAEPAGPFRATGQRAGEA
jgi:hypothetical protein